MARRGWRYIATRLNGDGTETMLHPDLPLEEVTIDDVLSGHAGISGKIEPANPALRDAQGDPILRCWQTAIYAENDGDIRAGAIVTRRAPGDSVLDIECTGFTGYAVDMPYTGSGYKGIKVDPIDVFRTIWGHIQSQRDGDLGLTFDQTDTGGDVSIGTELKQVEFDTQEGPVSFESGPYKLNWYTNHDLGSDLDDLANETPFDYHERHYWDGETIRHHVDIGYKKIGRKREDLSFTYGVNVFDPLELEEEGDEYASGVMVLGAGEGAGMIRAIREPVPLVNTKRLRRVAVVVDDTIKSRAAAIRRADRETQWRMRLGDVESVVVMDHPDAKLGAAKVGDEIFLRQRSGWKNIGMWVRILQISYQPANGNVAEYTVARTDKLLS